MKSNANWTEAKLASQAGKRVLITGANSGIGFETASPLAGCGAEVILARRSEEVLARIAERSVCDAIAELRSRHPGARLDVLELDLARQASVRSAAASFCQRFDRLDILINNAGVMWLPRSTTEDGLETQIGVNHFGHFSLTALLLPTLLKSPGSRIVTVSSLAHSTAELDLDDLFYTKRKYVPTKVYSQTKLANLLFARELGRRLASQGASTISVAAHPGVTGTNLFVSAFPNAKVFGALFAKSTSFVAQSPRKGARSTLYAATERGLTNGDYIGPGGWFELWGYPAPARSSEASKDLQSAHELWRLSEQITGIEFPLANSSNEQRSR